ncbi:hypothetical protein [Glycomyces buryatensis]|uniref:Uncharacterized protein n=1 Tax=Glycomyces buryatensis TaxID=2570927 RepID=A0A4S8QCB0_9ACTN|nr:hypothetical protein [Glycomyces buryatensis]THV42157.1 hypothetical protein FAB82_07925 [Glycomyces buryatensis]
MSAYQYYEFLAIDRPLTEAEQAEVRETSTRARINATSFVNEYHYGDYSGDTRRILSRYYDAHLYFAEWGSRQVMLKLPTRLVDLQRCEQYWANPGCTISRGKGTVVFDFSPDFEDDGEWEDVWDEGDLGVSLASIAGVRSEIAVGDLRGLYLAWLAAYGRWEIAEEAFPPDDEDRLEPPVPAGLGRLTFPQRALVDFLRIDRDLLAVAARTSTALADAAWPGVDEAIRRLSESDKDGLLSRVAAGEGAAVRLELARLAAGDRSNAVDDPEKRRTVGELLDAAAEHREQRLQRERLAAAAAADARAAAEAKRERTERDRRLREVARDPETAWERVGQLVEVGRSGEYDEAAHIVEDLWTLAMRDGHQDAVRGRLVELRSRYARRPAFQRRLDERDIPAANE